MRIKLLAVSYLAIAAYWLVVAGSYGIPILLLFAALFCGAVGATFAIVSWVLARESAKTDEEPQ